MTGLRRARAARRIRQGRRHQYGLREHKDWGGGGRTLLEKGFFLPLPKPHPLHLLRLLRLLNPCRRFFLWEKARGSAKRPSERILFGRPLVFPDAFQETDGVPRFMKFYSLFNGFLRIGLNALCRLFRETREEGFDKHESLWKRRGWGLGKGRRKLFFRKVSPPLPQSFYSQKSLGILYSTCRWSG